MAKVTLPLEQLGWYVLRLGAARGVHQRSAPGRNMKRILPIRRTASLITAGARCQKLAFGMLTLASAVLAACGRDSGSNGPPITISVSADPQMVQPGATAQVTAVVSNDTTGRGVSWTVSCSSAARQSPTQHPPTSPRRTLT